MAHLVAKQWKSRDLGFTRKSKDRLCDYQAFIPDPLVGRPFSFTGECAADIAEAETAIRSLDRTGGVLASTEGLARLLLRAEAAASSRIEGIEIGAGRLLRAEAARSFDNQGRPDTVADEVLANIDAMTLAMELADSEPKVTMDTILQIHERILRATALKAYAGRMRTSPSWIGGNGSDPCTASFVPPPYEEVPRLLEDLAEFCNDESLPAVAQAAVVHAQFETIHPFVDGNGRTGRALIHVLLRRRGVARSWVPPVSLVLATMQKEYIRGLDAYHREGPPDCVACIAGVNTWVSIFANACTRSVRDATLFEARIMTLQDNWRQRLDPVRSGSSADLLIDALPGMVIVTVPGTAALLGRSFTAANQAIDQFVKAGILKQVNVGKRNRAFEATEVVAAFTQLERRLASPAGDTHVAWPVRPAPRKKKR